MLHSKFFILHFHSSFPLFFLSEIFKELCTFKCIDAFNIFDIQFAFELSYISNPLRSIHAERKRLASPINAFVFR